MDTKGQDHFHGSRNHACLCGGLAEWLGTALGGISPAADGFGVVTIAPKVSRTLGPSSVAMSLRTVRGLVTSNWTRFDEALAGQVGDGSALLRLKVTLPPSAIAHLRLPLLSGDLSSLYVTEGSSKAGEQMLWDGSGALAVPNVHLERSRSPSITKRPCLFV